MEREKLKSRLGFILLSAGCAIGIGNVWKFPYMAGQGGGGAFVLFYLLFLVILGLPIMSMEFAVGRASHKSPVRAYQALEKPGQKWHIHGYFTLIGCYLLMMFSNTASTVESAAKAMNRKNREPHNRPMAMLAKMLGRVMKIRLGPLVWSTP